MKASFLRAVEALPLAVFLLYMAVVDPRAQDEWRLPYFAATALAAAGYVMSWRERATYNRISVGIALYFVSGTIALLTRWPWLNVEYGRLEGTAMLFWVLATGLGFTLFSGRGFLGVDAGRGQVRLHSWLLLAITLGCTAVSLHFVGNRLLSSFLPFIAVFVAHGLLRARLRHIANRA